MAMEKEDPLTGERFTWVAGESLQELVRPERIRQIEEAARKRIASPDRAAPNTPLSKLFFVEMSEEDNENACLICHL
jgi:hypothetical protein